LKSHEIEPESDYNLGRIGVNYKKIGDYSAAIKFFREAIKIDPDYAWYFGQLGDVFILLEEYEKAIEFFSKAHKLDETLKWVISDLSLCYLKLGDEQHSKDYLQKIDHEDVKNFGSLGYRYFTFNSLDKSLHFLEKYIQTQNFSGYDLLNYAHTLLCLGLKGKAIEFYKKSVKLLRLKPLLWDMEYDRPFLIQNGITQKEFEEVKKIITDFYSESASSYQEEE